MDQTLSTVKISKKAVTTANRYYGQKAANYDQRRQQKAKWRGEDQRVREILADFPEGTKVLDIPCGTGRFFNYYMEMGFESLGIDISRDMLEQCSGIHVREGSIFNIEVDDQAFDIALSIRFMNLIEAKDMQIALNELQRVAARVLFTLRVKQKNQTGHYHSPHPISAVEAALLPGRSIVRNEPIHEDDYRMVEIGMG